MDLLGFSALLHQPDWRRVLYGLLLFALVSIAGAASWKMFEFHDRLTGLENAHWERTLAAQHVYRHPIVLFGDSEIAGWPMAQSFGALPVLNRGLGGDWASRAEERFEHDVMSVSPSEIVILIGTNDVAHQASPEAILGHVEAMMKRAPHAHIVLCGLLPAAGEAASVRPRATLIDVNSRLASLAERYGADYVDFSAALTDDLGEFADGLTQDGLHPNGAGYLRMTQILLPKLVQPQN